MYGPPTPSTSPAALATSRVDALARVKGACPAFCACDGVGDRLLKEVQDGPLRAHVHAVIHGFEEHEVAKEHIRQELGQEGDAGLYDQRYTEDASHLRVRSFVCV